MKRSWNVRWGRHAAAGSLLSALCFASAPRDAHACGGTFCDIGPRAMPVDQTGENILFVMEGGKVEAHIQIQYRGDAARFSWILPVPALPEIEVGSEPLFKRLLAGTVPTFGYSTQRDSCGGGGGTDAGSIGIADASSAADGPGGNVVVAQKQVGAFETTTLSGGSTEVVDWLTTNGYQMSAEAPALFQDYVARGYLFVAVKLTGGTGIDQIHPLVVRYAGNKPCVPIKLTRVAAVDDMGIRTFFLGANRVGPTNYKSIVLNPAMLNWMALGSNYKDLVTRAADSPVANGKAFVTEYAGPTAIVGVGNVTPTEWNSGAFASLSPFAAVAEMKRQGFYSCGTGPRAEGGFFPPFYPYCRSTHPLVFPLLRDFVPPPATLSLNDGGEVITDPDVIEGYVYDCASCYASQLDVSRWDAAKFTAALGDRIVNPSRHADAVVATWPYLTRMFTTISPAEMTEDPEFEEILGLPTIPLPMFGVRRVTCSGQSGMKLPDGRDVALASASQWPAFTSEMPWVEKIEEPANHVVLVDNTDRINQLLKAWNDSQGWPPVTDGRTDGGGGAGAGGAGGSGNRGVDAGTADASTGGSGGGGAGSGGAAGTGNRGGNGGSGIADASTGGNGGADGKEAGAADVDRGSHCYNGRETLPCDLGDDNSSSRGCNCTIGARSSAPSALLMMIAAGVGLRRSRRRG